METNSNISATVAHTKVAQEADTLIVRSLFNESLPDYFWSGVGYPFLLIPAKTVTIDDVTTKVPVHYIDVENPSLTTTEVDSDMIVLEQLITSAWSESVSACEEINTGCFAINVTSMVDDALPVEVTNECDCTIDIPTSNSVVDTFTFALDQPSLSALEFDVDKTVISDQDPFYIQLKGSEDSLFSRIDKFDVKDYFGNGVIFSNPNSTSSRMLNQMFSGEYTNDILEKVKNYGANITDVETADVATISNMSEMLGSGEITFMDNSPTDVEKLVKLASLEYDEVFGQIDNVSKYDTNNIGELLSLDSEIVADETLFYQRTDLPESEIETLVVPNLNVGLSSIDASVLLGSTTYALSGLDIENIDPTQYCFWRIKEDATDERVDLLAIADTLLEIPDEEDWADILEKKIQRSLLTQI